MSLGYSAFYAPSYYRYRDYCDPRYCYRYDRSYDSGAYRSAPSSTGNAYPADSAGDATQRPSSEGDLRGQRVPDGARLRVPLLPSLDPPDAVL